MSSSEALILIQAHILHSEGADPAVDRIVREDGRVRMRVRDGAVRRCAGAQPSIWIRCALSRLQYGFGRGLLRATGWFDSDLGSTERGRWLRQFHQSDVVVGVEGSAAH